MHSTANIQSLGTTLVPTLLLLLTVVILNSGFSEAARVCKKVDSCSCVFEDNGQSISLRSLDQTDGTARFHALSQQDHYNYTWNPCTLFSEGDCKDSSICKQNGSLSDNLAGKASKLTMAFQDNNQSLVITYVDEEITYSFITVECVLNKKEPSFTAYGKQPSAMLVDTYNFRLQTECGCPGVCPFIAPDKDKISAGSVLLIIFFIILVTYLIFGILFNIRRKEEGLRVFPNYDFWSAFLGLVRDGFVFVFTCAFFKPPVKTYDAV